MKIMFLLIINSLPYMLWFQKQYRGLCAQDLQEAKDLMLVETADMLRVGAVNVLIMILILGHVFFSFVCCVFAKIME